MKRHTNEQLIPLVDVAEMLEAIDPDYNKSEARSSVFPSIETGVYRWFSNGIMAAVVYGMLFVAFMLVSKGTITRDGVVLPAVALFAVISLVQYLVKGDSQQPRWLVIGAFLISIAAAGVMTIILH